MTATTTTTTNSKNGQPRKTLASQLDRLDGILDALSDGLNQAVAFTVEEAVKQAVQVAIVEVLTNPDLVARLHAAPVTPNTASTTTSVSASAPATSIWGKLKGLAKSAWNKACALAKKVCAGTIAVVKQVGGYVCSLATGATQKVSTTAQVTWLWALMLASLAKQFRTPLLVASGVAALSALAVCFAGPYFAALAGWLGGFVTTLAFQVALAFRRLTAGGNEA